MKNTFVLLAVLLTLAASAQKPKEQQNGPHRGGGMMMENKDADSTFVALKNETLAKFKQFTFNDTVTDKTMQYNLFVPEGYDGTEAYPLVLFMADASTVNKDVTVPLTQGYGALEFASDRDQQKHPSFVLVPQYTTWTVGEGEIKSDEVEMTIRLLQSVMGSYNVDRSRVYTTGQSMGGMMSFHFNIKHPNLFAASLFVSCQWDTTLMHDFGQKTFFYIVAAGDERASAGMNGLTEVLEKQGVAIHKATWSAKLPQAEQDAKAQALIDEGGKINFIVWEKGTVLPESGQGMEHMASFDYAYKLAPVRDWLFEQKK
ncbi:MAG: hypothetical protein IJP44_09360 [Bacteroidales bacterium]|nr:hypothetical protein [Bacteroidales bacterium]